MLHREREINIVLFCLLVLVGPANQYDRISCSKSETLSPGNSKFVLKYLKIGERIFGASFTRVNLVRRHTCGVIGRSRRHAGRPYPGSARLAESVRGEEGRGRGWTGPEYGTGQRRCPGRSMCGCGTTAPIGMVGIGYWRSSNGIEHDSCLSVRPVVYVQDSRNPLDPVRGWESHDGGGKLRRRDVPHTFSYRYTHRNALIREAIGLSLPFKNWYPQLVQSSPLREERGFPCFRTHPRRTFK